MAIPSSYTEISLRDYMLSVTANVAGAVGWTAVNFTEAANDALVAYGVTDIALATDIAKLRCLARAEAWRALVAATAADIKFTADGATFERQQFHQQCVAALERAEGEAVDRGYMELFSATISLGSIKHSDPYLTDESLYQ
jgi:hypothetical protein